MIGQSSVIKLVLCGLLCFGVGLIVLNYFSSIPRQSDPILRKNDNIYDSKNSVSTVLNEIKADFKSDTKPMQLTVDNSKLDSSKSKIRKYKIPAKNAMDQEILVRESGKGKYHILLLHGQGSSSKIWEDIGTLQYLSNWGYRAVAIDIPSNGNNSLPVKGDKEAVQWLTRLISRLELKNLVIISPSMSGRLTLPYVFQLNEKQILIRGFVPIAPVGTNNIKADDYKKIKIPTLIVHGGKDFRFQYAFENLKNIPTSEILLIKDASHSSYVEKPIEFHNNLRQFLYKIYRPIYKNSWTLSKEKFPARNRNTTKYKIRRFKPSKQ